MDNPHKLPIDGILDLHQFQPRELSSLLEAYIEACLEHQVYYLRIIHGKGIGVLRERVHALLKNHSAVESHRLDSGSSSWGATLVELKKEYRR